MGGEGGKELCGVECVAALERVEGLRRERARSMRAMEQRILALQHEQQLATQQQQQQAALELDGVEQEEKEEMHQSVVLPGVPVLSLPVVAANALES